MEHRKITVIIPVFNVESYLSKCMDSVINQSYPYLEILLINDGSTDGSKAICDAYAAKDNRVKVVNKSNGGQSSARNVGISLMTGDYVSFVDSDDWLDEKMYETMLLYLDQNGADVSVCQAYYCREGRKPQPERNDGKVYLIEGYINMMGHVLPYQEPFMKFQAWNKLYKSELVRDIRFKEGQVYEEIDFERKVLKNAKKAVCFNIPLYYYRVGRPGSTISSFDNRRLVKFTDLESCMSLFVDDKDKEYLLKYLRYSMNTCLEFSYLSYSFHKGTEVQNTVRSKFEEYKNTLKRIGYKTTFRQKVYELSPRLHYLILFLFFKLRH